MILSFSQLGKHGRLGNQLFQVAGTLGLAEKHGAQAAFPAWQYEPYFETPIPHGPMAGPRIEERFFHFHDWNLTGDSDLLGYLQSEKYFGSQKLKLRPAFVEEQKVKHPELFLRETICIQIRRGDYVDNPNYYQLSPTYYLSALITHFPHWRDCNLLIISDGIEYCRTHFECLPNATFSTGNTDIQDLALACACDHFILSNSSFGWWCAWLGEKPHSKIVHSGHMFAGKLARKDARDSRPDRWIEHKRDTYKIPLRDLTITIPVFLDHPTRKENLDLCLFLLQSAFDTNYIVCEQGGRHFNYTSQWGTYQHMDSPVFHRTQMLNQMAVTAETPYIANWDCDVIVPPAQLYMAVEALRAGADMVFPYDGRFARMPRGEWFAPLQKGDIGIVGNTMFKGREPEHTSVGGAVLWNKEAFIDGGMENEHFISFGPEDCERHDRFKTLGYDIRRIGGSLFHLNHYVGPNSSPRNPHFAANEKELEKIRRMSRADLHAYIDTWPWRHKYTGRYYHEISEGSIRSARAVFDALGFQPESVIDIGCGVGEWNNGVADYWGVDYRVRKEDLLIPADHFIECDLNKEVLSVATKFDLCLCLEVAEHLKPSRAEQLVKLLCSLSDRVLFSAAIPHQGGTGHINEQWQSWWAELFAHEGFGASDRQPGIRCNPDIEFWYRQNIVLYERGARGNVEDYVMPAYYMQIVEGLKR